MCLMAPARVVATDGTICEVEVGGRVDKASMMLEPDLVVGDWVLVNSGTVVRKLDEEQAAEMAHAFGILYGLTDSDGVPLASQRRTGLRGEDRRDRRGVCAARTEGSG